MKRSLNPTGYESWIEEEGIPLVEGFSVDDIAAVRREPWARLGGSGAYIQLHGMEGLTGAYVLEIPAGKALNEERHLYQEVTVAIQGRGVAEYDFKSSIQTAEWGPGSCFVTPRNVPHKLVNTGSDPALLLAVTDAPLLFDLLRDPDLILGLDHDFQDGHVDVSNFFRETDDFSTLPWGERSWRTNYVTDVYRTALQSTVGKAQDEESTRLELAENSLIAHFSDWPSGVYHTAHYHAAGAVLLGLQSRGYCLMWPKEYGTQPFESGNGDKVVRFDWRPGTVYSPPNGWFHQHFNTGSGRARHMALRFGSTRYPVGFHLAGKGFEDATVRSVRAGGTLIDYEDEDPAIRRGFEAALRDEGLESRMSDLF